MTFLYFHAWYLDLAAVLGMSIACSVLPFAIVDGLAAAGRFAYGKLTGKR